MKKPAAKKKKGGAPKGNKNAFKHGFYSKNFTPSQNAMLDKTSVTDITSEINALRVILNELLKQISFEPVMIADDKGNERRDDHYLAQIRTADSITVSVGGHIRTYFLTNKSGDVAQGIMEAIMSLDPYKEL